MDNVFNLMKIVVSLTLSISQKRNIQYKLAQ